MAKLRNYALDWVRDDGETGTTYFRAENGQRARILYMGQSPQMVQVTVRKQEPPKRVQPNFYSVALAILADNIYMNGYPPGHPGYVEKKNDGKH
jgi:hypothetical protein